MTLDEILDKYWDDIRKDEELVTTIQDRAKTAILKIISGESND